MGNPDRDYRLKKAKEALQAEIASKETEVQKLNDSIKFKKSYLKHIDDLFETREIEVKNFWYRTFCFFVNQKNEIVKVRRVIITSPNSPEEKDKCVSLIDGKEAIWKFIDDNFGPFVYKLEEIIPQISLKDGKKLVELMKEKYEEETNNIVDSLDDPYKEPFSTVEGKKITLGMHPFYQHLALYVNSNGEIYNVEVLDREDERYCIKSIDEYERINFNPLAISVSEDYEAAWTLIKNNILSYIDDLSNVLNYLNLEEQTKLIETIKQARVDKKPMSLSK